jgi:putative phosphonate metabolism protein
VTFRYAIYWAPPSGAPLARIGQAWLGRSAETGRSVERTMLDGFSAAELEAITAEPQRYGLHATLKAPFRLAPGRGAVELEQALAGVARRTRPLTVPPLRLKRIGRFLALVPGHDAGLEALAAACVEGFDEFRAPPDAAELARRRTARLTPAQEANLARWGYPYVMADFRFHVTLTGPIDPAIAAHLEPRLVVLFAEVMTTPLVIDALALFVEPTPGTPFRLVRRMALDSTMPDRARSLSRKDGQ